MKKIIALVSVLVAVIIILVYFYFKNTFSLQNSSKGITAIPAHAALILRFENNREFYELYGSNPLFKTLLGESYLEELSFVKTLFAENLMLREQLNGKEIYASVHRVRSNQCDVLFVVNIDKRRSFKKPEELFREYITPKNTIRTRKFGNTALHEFIFSESGKTLAFAIKDRLLLVSYTPALVEESIRQLDSGEVPFGEHNLKTVKSGASDRALAQLYVNYSRLNEFTSAFSTAVTARLFNQLRSFAGWSSLDFNFKSDAFMLSGYTSVLKGSGNYLELFLKQRSGKHEIPEILPSTTAAFIDFNLNDYMQFRSDMRSYLKQKNKERLNKLQWAELDQRFGFSLEEQIARWMGNEFAIAVGENSGSDLNNEFIQVIKVANTNECLNFFSMLNADTSSGIAYKDFSIGTNPVPELFQLICGDVFSKARSQYYTLINEFLVMAADPMAIRSVIDKYISLQTLKKNSDYLAFETFITSESNVYAYANTESSFRMLNYFSNDDFKAKLAEGHTGIREFYGIACQFSSDGEHFFTSFYWPLKAIKKQDNTIEWKFELDAVPISQPAVVINHETREKELIVQDENNDLYLLSGTGKLLWKAPVKGRIISEITQVDFFKNGKLQYLFNTKTHVYLLDRNGKALPPYPIRLAAPATCAMSVFDYEKTRNYRLFIPCENGNLYGYSLDGRPLEGWNPKTGIGILLHPVQHVLLEGKDYLFVYNNKGDIYFLNRKGQVLIRHLEEDITLYRNPFVLDTVTAGIKPRFITTDTTGTIRSMFFDGRKLYKHIGTWTNTHFFDYKDVAGDNNNEYIFLDKNQLFVYGSDTTLIFNYEFLYDILQRPQFIREENGKYLIGVSSDKTDQVFLFKNDGTLYKNFPLKGSTRFTITKLRDQQKNNLVVGSSDKNIYVYKIEY